MSNEFKIAYTLRTGEGDDALLLELSLEHGQQVRGNLMGNGKGNYMLLQAPGAKEPGAPFLKTELPKLAELFDPTFTLANKIDSQWLIERLLARRIEIEADESLDERIKGLIVVSNLMGLHAVGSDIMNQLYGYNWVVEQSASLIKQSKDWLSLIGRISRAQAALNEALSS